MKSGNKVRDIIDILMDLVHELESRHEHEHEMFRSHFMCVNKHDLETAEHKIMSAISDFAIKQNTFNTRLDAAITGLAGDIKALNDIITALQTTPGPISPEDQALLDDLQASSEKLLARIEALDALTPPVVPPEGPA